MDGRLNIVELHDYLHGFCAGRGTGTAILEAKLVQQLAYLEQKPLFGLFLDLRKAYDAMDRGRCVEILKAYGTGPNMLKLIESFWVDAELACRAMGRYVKPFKACRGVTQGGPLSPKIFNIMVDAVVREWMRQILGEEDAQSGYGDAVRLFVALFYADDAYIAALNKEELQESMNILIGLFEQVGLRTNTTKTVSMTCIPGRIRTRHSSEAYTRAKVGFQTAKAWNSRRLDCDICGAKLSAQSLSSHLET